MYDTNVTKYKLVQQESLVRIVSHIYGSIFNLYIYAG